MTRLDATGRDETRPDKTRQGFTIFFKPIKVGLYDMAGLDETRLDLTRQDKTRQQFYQRNNMNYVNQQPPNTVRSTDTNIIIDLLKKVEKGGFISYQELIKATYAPNLKKIRSSISTARKHLCNEELYVFKCVHREGYQRLTDDEIGFNVGKSGIKRIRRLANKTANQLDCADFSQMSNEAIVTHNTTTSVIGALITVTKPTLIRQIRNKVEQTNEKIMISILDQFKKN